MTTTATARVCACGCGLSLDGRRRQARYLDVRCRVRALRARRAKEALEASDGCDVTVSESPTEPEGPAKAKPCECDSQFVCADDFGEVICGKCGRRRT